jgi:predicted nucleic acid-binding protein
MISSVHGRRAGSVADRRLILDSNILVRAVLGIRVRDLLEQYSVQVDLFAPDSAFLEVEEHLPKILVNRRLPAVTPMAVYSHVKLLIHELSIETYGVWETEARLRLHDPDDWTVLACAMALDCPIWTEERDFFGAGIATWSSDRVEIYLRGE